MKQRIIEGIKAKFEGLDDALIERVASAASRKYLDETSVDEYLNGLTLMQVVNSFKDASVNDAIKTHIKNNTQKPATPQPKAEEIPTPNSEFAQLLEVINGLKSEITSLKADKVYESRSSRFLKLINELPDNYKRAYQRTDIKSLNDEEFSSLLADIADEVKGINESISAQQSATKGGFGARQNTPTQPTKEATDAEVDAVLQSMGYSTGK